MRIVRKYGPNNLENSSLCFGTMQFGDGASERDSHEMYEACRNSGINFFDTAYVYTGGKSEVILGKLIKEARTQNNLSVKELSNISKIPESSINSIENNIEDLRPRNPFLRSILLKLEKCLSLENNTLVGLEIRETNTFEKNKKKVILRKFDFLNSWQGSFFYFLFLILILFFLNRYFISNINIIEIQIIEEKGK